jgi:hypothetical protein
MTTVADQTLRAARVGIGYDSHPTDIPTSLRIRLRF